MQITYFLVGHEYNSGIKAERNPPMDMHDLWFQGTKEEWLGALMDYWQCVDASILELEWQFEKLDSEWIGSMTTEEFYRFLHDQFFVWKYSVSNRLSATLKQLERYQTEKNYTELKRVQAQLFSFHRNNCKEGLAIAKTIRGLGTCGASGLLGVLFPRYFCTVEQNVVKTLLQIEWLPEHYELEYIALPHIGLNDAELVTTILKRKAQELNSEFGTDFWTPRKISMVLSAAGAP